MKEKTFKRYHRFDNNGIKEIKRFELHDVIPQIPDVGYTVWIRGTGPFNPIALNNVQNGVRKACKGVPKPLEQRQKMRQAKLGVPKTPEHKQNMKKSWERRRQKLLESHEQKVDQRVAQTV